MGYLYLFKLNISGSFTHKMALKPAGIDMELINYVTVILFIESFGSQLLRRGRNFLTKPR